MTQRSDAWKFFEKINEKVVRCRVCRRHLTFCGGTTNMCRHLASKHPLVAPTMTSYSTGKHVIRTDQSGVTRRAQESRWCSAARQEELTRLLATFVTDNILPASIVESPSLRNILTYCEPNFTPPSGDMITSRLRQLEHDSREAMREEMQSATVVNIAVDMWTSSVDESYMSVTASYVSEEWRLETPLLDTVYLTTDADVVERLHDVTEQWGITSKIAVCVLDGSANCIDAASRNGWTEVTCAAHTLQMCVEDGLGINVPGKESENIIASTVNAASRLVGHFINNPLATLDLENRLSAIFAEPQSRKLIWYTKSRWTSLVDMLETLTELRWIIVETLNDSNVTKPCDASILDLTDDKWKLMADILPVLQPLKAATDLLCAESESTSACTVVYPTLFGLLKFHLTAVPTDCATLCSFKETVSLQIIRRFALDQYNDSIINSPIAAATVFDPVQKGLLLFDDSVRNCLYARIRQEITSLAPQQEVEATAEADEMKHNPVPLKLSRREQLRILTGGHCGRPAGTNSTASHHITELDRYLAANDDNDDEDVLQYWKAREYTYPLMSQLARKYLGVPATSSRMTENGLGGASDLCRVSVSPDMANCLIFLNKIDKIRK